MTLSLSLYRNELLLIKDTGKRVSMYFQYRLKEKTVYSKLLGYVFGWRRRVFLEIARKVNVGEEVWEFDTGVRLKLLILALPKTNTLADAYWLADTILELPVEDLIWWNYKFNKQTRDRAYRAFRVLYQR